MHINEIISTHPAVGGAIDPALVATIEALFDCAQTCTTCADASLAEDSVVALREVIRRDLDCADVCTATGRIVSRRAGSDAPGLKPLLEVCAEICRACAEECERHSEHVHCRVCAEVCRRCEQACGTAAGALTAPVH
jgi:Domain of Unknown Function (DUF326)